MEINISVIIPIYNAAEHLDRCVRSLAGQTLQRIELIFVDDCSKDNSIAILEKAITESSLNRQFIKIIQHGINRGVSAARNTGLKHASGKYLGWLDADDWIDPRMFEIMLAKIRSDQSDIVWCDFYNCYTENQLYISQKYDTLPKKCLHGLIKGELMGVLWNKLIRKSLFEKNNILFPEGFDMCEDLRISVQLFYYAEGVSYIPQALYYYIKYRTDSISIRNTGSFQINSAWIENIRCIVDFVEEKEIAGIEEDLLLLKLTPKKNLLIKGTSVEYYQQWCTIFPESNPYLWRTKIPVYYKFLAWMAMKNILIPIKLGLFLKSKLKTKSPH